MAKFYGPIGYVSEQVEIRKGVWEDQMIERNYSGDVLEITNQMPDGEGVNKNLTVNNRLSIVADPYAYEKFQAMRYVKWLGAFWEITSVKVLRPRLILSIGGVYNGPKA